MAKNILLVSLFSVLPLQLFAQILDFRNIAACESLYQNCALSANSTVSFQNCTTTFDTCLTNTAYKEPDKTLECFKAEAAWDAATYQLNAAVSIFMMTFLGIPAVMKAIAKMVNYANKIDENGHRKCGCFGRVLLFFTDGNEDGEVKPNELLQPTMTFLGGFSFTTFLSATVKAINAQAPCDYAKTKVPAA